MKGMSNVFSALSTDSAAYIEREVYSRAVILRNLSRHMKAEQVWPCNKWTVWAR